MSANQPFDSEQFKENLLRQWNSVAPAWQQWWEIWDNATQSISERLVELAKLDAGQQVLDVATGLGEPAITAAQRVGSSGRVVATDFSSEMLAKARDRATALGIENIEFHQIDAESLNFPSKDFDAALSRWGVTELPNLPIALGKIHQHLSSGGLFAVAVWASPPDVPAIGLPVGTLIRMFEVPPPAPGTPSPFGLGDKSRLADVLTDAGFKEVSVENQTINFEFPSFEIYRTFLEDIAPVVRNVLGNQTADKQAEAWQAVSDSVQTFTRNDGSLLIPNEVFCAVGKS